MNDYLVEYETLAKLIDSLIAKKYSPQPTAEELEAVRSENIRKLDDSITDAIFGRLTGYQAAKLSELLDSQTTTSDDYKAFFQKNNIDIEQIITQAMQDFASKFLGGNNG